MLYTVRPFEDIYRKDEKQDKANTKQFYKNGMVVHASKSEEGYIVDGISSTIPSDYLDEQYFPGARMSDF